VTKILVTGSSGFIGRNLIEHLKVRDGVTVLRHDVENSREELHAALAQADAIVHLAGVNRPDDPAEYEAGNAGLTHDICAQLIATGRKTPLIFSSSIQAELANPYGVSKHRAEAEVEAYAAATGALVAIYRLPNVFGKFCRPDYNSVVATFCHRLAHDREINVSDPNAELTLAYVDDVVEEFQRALAGSPTRRGAFCVVPVADTYRVTLARIVDLLRNFQRSRSDLQLPDLADGFTKKLYATYLSYLPAGKFSYPLTTHADARGCFAEFLRTPERGQVSVNISKPGITRGNHWHHTKNEKFLVVSGRGVIRFRKLGESAVQEYLVSSEKLEAVDIPPGYVHNIENLGDTDLVTVMWASEAFDPARPDTWPEKV
jgi:UDP-2-acetamido-2,6-beta-L-arabino-hexul-4-ose reductase